MGAKRLRKSYEKPKKLWEKERIETEKKLRVEYGLKSARELWKMLTILRRVRREARILLAKRDEKRINQLIGRVKRYFINKESVKLDDILSLTVRDILERRLQTVVCKKHMAVSQKQARQFITHGKIAIGENKISSPNYIVKFSEEARVTWNKEPVLQSKMASVQKEEVEAGITRVEDLPS